MKKVKVGVVVEKFPVLSQQFILRAVEELAKNDNVDITVLTIYPFSLSQLKKHSEFGYQLYIEGRISVKSLFNASKPKLLFSFICALIKYVVAVVCKRKLSFSSVFSLGIKYHTKAVMFSSLVRKEKFDVVHAQFMDIAVYVCLARCISATGFGSVFATGRGADVTRDGFIPVSGFKVLSDPDYGVDRFFFVSNSLKKFASNLLDGKAKSMVVHSGMDVSKFIFREVFERKEKVVRLVQVGRLVEKKGVMQSIKMVERISQVAGINLSLTVVGDGPLFDEAKKYVAGRNLSQKIDLIGAKSNEESMGYIAGSDIMLVPSITASDGNSEGIPNVAKEAMALGCIVVASDHSGLPELIEDGVTGFMFSEGVASEFDQKILEALANRDMWPSMATRARCFVEKNFSSEKIARETYDAYAEVLD